MNEWAEATIKRSSFETKRFETKEQFCKRKVEVNESFHFQDLKAAMQSCRCRYMPAQDSIIKVL